MNSYFKRTWWTHYSKEDYSSNHWMKSASCKTIRRAWPLRRVVSQLRLSKKGHRTALKVAPFSQSVSNSILWLMLRTVSDLTWQRSNVKRLRIQCLKVVPWGQDVSQRCRTRSQGSTSHRTVIKKIRDLRADATLWTLSVTTAPITNEWQTTMTHR